MDTCVSNKPAVAPATWGSSTKENRARAWKRVEALERELNARSNDSKGKNVERTTKTGCETANGGCDIDRTAAKVEATLRSGAWTCG